MLVSLIEFISSKLSFSFTHVNLVVVIKVVLDHHR